MAHEQVVGILNEMSPDDRTALLEELPSAAARQLIRLLTPEERQIAQALLGYPEGSVGRLMTPDFIAVREDWSVLHVLDYVREYGRDSETLNFVYVVDERGHLIDDVRIRGFLLKPLTAKVSEIRDQSFEALKVNDSQEEALNVFRKYDRAALPVVDSNDVLVGIVTSDNMLDVAEEEATEDIQKFGGMEALDEPYMRISAWSIVGEKYFHRELYGPHWPLVAITVGLALVGVVLWGSLSGSMLPFVLRRVGADPATSSAPFVATLVDVTGLMIYFSIALVIMRGVML